MKMGILSINKAKDMTSHDVVSILRKKLNMKKIGHTGTLDPMATGVLPICIGNATRVAEYIVEQGKSYKAEFKFGIRTTTYDITGDIIERSDNVNFSQEEIENVLRNFRGEISQKPPIYSAIKVDGKKLYEYARENKEVDVKSRNVNIYELDLIEISGDICKIHVKCSKGTYIRSLINDIGESLGSYATMTSLVRTSVGRFTIDKSIDISNIDNISKDDLLAKLISIDDAVYNLNSINLSEEFKFRLINGQRINIKDLPKNIKLYFDEDIKLSVDGEFLGIARIKDRLLKMEKLIWQK